METKTLNNVKLGTFVLAGLLILMALLYLIGNNMSLFGESYRLKARFENVQGLVAGNNVRFSGIQAGIVKGISILNDTTLEVSMLIEKKMMPVIRKNAVVSIGTDGLVGDKVVNIIPSREPGALAAEGDILFSKKTVNPEEMLQTLHKTNSDVAVIAAELKITVQRINSSSAVWAVLNDKSLPANIRNSIANIRFATGNAGKVISKLDSIITDIKNGKGSVGSILRDSSFAKNLNDAILKIKSVGVTVDSLAFDINRVVKGVETDLNTGKGTANALLKDSGIVIKLNATLDNIEKGTRGFNQNMEALKHNILFRGYFKKLEKQKEKDQKEQASKKGG